MSPTQSAQAAGAVGALLALDGGQAGDLGEDRRMHAKHRPAQEPCDQMIFPSTWYTLW